ncbi:MAG TPA: DUF3662 and FHA domain-containing protein [Actinomycetota bacterium]|nr:DUF3662 and FHA domain-containing protein [Actinomycetota bacterium]
MVASLERTVDLGLVDEFEKRLERVVEGVFSKAFRSDIEPAELGRRLLREMEAGKSVSVGAVYVPNDYVIRLGPEDFGRFEGLVPTLRTEFATLLKTNAGQRRWRLPGPINVRFEPDEAMKAGRFEVEAFHLAADPSDPYPSDPDVLVQLGSNQSWRLDSDEVTMGRSSSNGIVVDDPNASRSHARLIRREDGWWITDLDSTNGTLVNEVMIKERRLSHGDRIKIGATELEYREAASGVT